MHNIPTIPHIITTLSQWRRSLTMEQEIVYYKTISDNRTYTIAMSGITDKNPYFYNSQTKSKYYIFEFLLSGQGTINIDNKTYFLKKNDFYIVPANSNYEYFTEVDDPYQRYWVCMEGTLIDGLYNTYFKEKNIVIANADFSPYFKQLFNILKKSDDILTDEHDIPLLIHEFFLTAANNLSFPEYFNSKSVKGSAATLKNYICSNFSRSFSLQEMSDKFCMSKNQIINVFKKEYHITPQLFSTLYKLDMAEEMLKRGTSVKETSQYLGYSTDKYFSSIFKKYKKKSPSQVKKHNNDSVNN